MLLSIPFLPWWLATDKTSNGVSLTKNVTFTFTLLIRKGGNHSPLALASHQCGPGSNPGVDAICGLSLLLVLSLAPRGFSPGAPVFPSPQKPTFPNSNSTRNQVDEEPLCGCATCKSLFIHLFIYLGFRTRWCHISHTTSKTHAL